jgi:ATP-dependent Lhr-like helicase
MNSAMQSALQWFKKQGWSPFPFQIEAWQSIWRGESGLVNAPTGSGKTYSLLIPILLEPADGANNGNKHKGPRAIWITPIRALSKEIELSAKRAIEGLGLNWQVGVRSGDTSTKERAKQKENPPDFLITTPESLHLLLSQKGYNDFFAECKMIVVDEWHELIGSKRGVLMELALSRLKTIIPSLKIWGISATIGNMEQSLQVLLGNYYQSRPYRVIKADIKKQVEIVSIFPDEIERMPWAGHLGIQLLDKVIPIIQQSKTTLIFTNTRSFAEIWYQKILDKAPELSGLIAMHHGSISKELRDWVEEQLHEGKLKAVVCTSSLDLGVDFRPVETIIQVGSPKGVARFLQQ